MAVGFFSRFHGGASLLMFLTLTSSMLEVCQTEEKVSFYGASYIHLSLQEAKSATDISFRFRTHLPDAVLLLAAGKTDYCVIKLESGRLKVHINLGAGEKELASARELTLNDLSWHEVNLTRRDANITLQIDVIHRMSDVLPGRFFELNINYGVFIGGQSESRDVFLGHREYFRGCMADIMYNGIRVVEQARIRKDSDATAVSWGCAQEFEASRRSEVSFVEEGAFAAIYNSIPRTESRLELELKTASSVGLLLYQAAANADFLGIELTDGKIRLLMNKGNGPTELIHQRQVNDGSWHKIIFQFNFYVNPYVSLTIDDSEEKMSLLAGNKYLDLSKPLYLGGTELSKRAGAMKKGLKSGDVSYKGCLRNMLIDGKEFGMPDVKVSQGLLANCVWGFPCTESQPCITGATCSQLGVRSFECSCDQLLCAKSTFDNQYKLDQNLPITLEIISVRAISVYEGKKAHLSSDNVNMILDIAKYAIKDSEIFFVLLELPAHGSLHFNKSSLTRKSTFSLQDVNQDKVIYQHDGTETHADSMVLKLTIQTSLRIPLAVYFQDSLNFTLHVNVTSVNDPPIFEISSTNALELAQGTRKTLTRSLIWAHDEDTPAESLVYVVLRNDSNVGYVERISQPSKSISTFTQAELSAGVIDYVHRGKGNSEAILGLVVKDGAFTSPPQYLRINAYALELNLLHNTGLIVVHGSSSYLTSANLTFATNSDDPTIDLLYDVVMQPQYGNLQRQRESNGNWIRIDNFTSQDLEQLAVRYSHNIGSPSHDQFSFRVSARNVKSPKIYNFNITFINLELLEIHRNDVNFTNSQYVVLSTNSLKYQTNPLITDKNMIVYSLLEAPRYGDVLANSEKVEVGQTFKQADVDNSKVQYRHFRRAYSNVDDSFAFKVTAPQCSDIIDSMAIRYLVAKNTKVPDGNQLVRVVEGQRGALIISPTDFREFGVSKLAFNLIKRPKHGWLSIYNETRPISSNVTYFTYDDVTTRSVYYVHDDSETMKDSLKFLALSIDDSDFMYIGSLNFEIELRNDNAPERVSQRVFQVVSKSEKLITSKDLLYEDKDYGTRPSDLIYSVMQLSNGTVYKVNRPDYRLTQFTQQDVNDERIMYRHRGKQSERLDFTVTDGQLSSKGALHINAGPPFVKLMINDGLVVQSNRSASLSVRDIDVETNVYGNLSDVKFKVIDRPRYGLLMKDNREIMIFDYHDLTYRLVSYKHIGPSARDQFKLRVVISNTKDEAAFSVRIFPKSYWEPLIIHSNKTLFVEEATSVALGRNSLEIMHPEIQPGNIVYHVRDWPINGHIEISNDVHTGNDDNADYEARSVKHFSQETINEQRVYYVQSISNQTKDKFVVDVTNGINWLYNLTVSIVIVPSKLHVAAKNLTVNEGSSVIIQDSDFYAQTPYYFGKITDYKIIEKPRHGSVMDSASSHFTTAGVKKFSRKHLNTGSIIYKHNSDEFPSDRLKMIAIAGDKSSEPFDVWINVIPVNDQVPYVVNKSHVDMWQGASIVVTNEMLASIDNDSSASDIVYNVISTINGYLALKDSPAVQINTFSQEAINEGRILFAHTNGSQAEFSFTVTDGLHKTPKHTISVGTRPVLITLRNNKVLNIFPLARKLITNELLLSECTDLNRDVKYFVREGPKLGKIIMETRDGTWLEVDGFTQKDINDSKVTYEHRHKFMNLYANDSFAFDIEAAFAPTVTHQIFRVDISVSNGDLQRYVSYYPVRVIEGGSASVTLNISGIVNYLRNNAGIGNPEIFARLAHQPSHGHVMIQPHLNLSVFNQHQVERGIMLYTHDNSDTLRDEINLTFFLNPGYVTLCNVSVPVDVTPVNDEKFELKRKNPIEVVQNQTQILTKEILLTLDPDTEPQDLLYEIINTKPEKSSGRFLLLSTDENSKAEFHTINNFTQHDINSYKVIYEHSGSLVSPDIYMRVSDGHFPQEYFLLPVNVHPIKLSVTVVSPVKIQQGRDNAIIDTDNIQLETNVRQELVTYTVTRHPNHGELFMRDKRASSFLHTDLLSKSVIYFQSNMSASNDSFELSARISEFIVRKIYVPIQVLPLMIANSMVVLTGERKKLSLHYIDVTPLAQLTSSNPVFAITQKPKYATIKRIMNSTSSSGERRGTREKEVSKFTHQDIVSGVIYVVCNKVPTTDAEGVVDYFEFVVTSSLYQPALGKFLFTVKLNVDDYNNTIGGPMDPVGHEGEMTVAPNMSNDYLLILGMLVGVFFLGVIVIVIIKCRHGKYKGTDKEQDKVEPAVPSIGVMQLPRPPDHLLPPTPHLKRFANDRNNSLQSSTPLPPMSSLTSTLPQCKVIPLNPLESMTGSDIDVSARYPYGVADPDEWSSFDTGDIPCPSQTCTQQRNNPLLRRNQYWV